MRKRYRKKWREICEIKNVMLEHLYHKPLLKPEDIMEELRGYSKDGRALRL